MRRIHCIFELNRQRHSRFSCTGFGGVVAYSGTGSGRNNPDAQSLKDIGPIPKGTYFLVDRQPGGRLAPLRNLWNRYGWGSTDHTRWFALWNPKTGDYTEVNGITRGEFRLHPMGPLGQSKGCIVILKQADFQRLDHYLRSRNPELPIPNSRLKAYGTVEIQ